MRCAPVPRCPTQSYKHYIACSDGFEFRCDNGEPLRVTFALDCCDREAMSWAATTAGHSGDIVRDVMLAAVENRFGSALHTPSEIEWLSDNGSGYTADETRRFAMDIGLKLLTTPCAARKVTAWQRAS